MAIRKKTPLLYKDRKGRLIPLDSNDVMILKKILEDGGLSDALLSEKLGIGHLEVTKKRKKMKGGSVLTKSYWFDVAPLGWRVGDININVEKGNSEKVAKKVFKVNANIEEITLRIDSTSNVTARIYYKDSEELNSIMESIRAMPFVKGAHFSEIIKVISMRSVGEMSGVFDSRMLKPKARGGGVARTRQTDWQDLKPDWRGF